MTTELLTRREAVLENAIRELLECSPTSDEYSHLHSGSKSQRLRAEADWVDRRDAAILHARKLLGFDPSQQR